MTFYPGAPTHLHTYTPLAFKHEAEKQISNAHFKHEFTFILTYYPFFGMDLVAPGRTFSRQGRGKVPRGSGTTCAKRACCIYLVNTNKRWAPEIPRFYYQQNALQNKYFFKNPNDEKVCRWVGGPKTTPGSMKSAPPTYLQTINILGSSEFYVNFQHFFAKSRVC